MGNTAVPSRAFILALAALALALAPAAVRAEQASKWYVSGAMGSNWVEGFDAPRDVGFTGLGSTQDSLSFDMKSSTSYLGAIGYRFTDAWSVQAEWARRSNLSESVSSGIHHLPRNDIRLTSKSLMANAIYTVQGLGPVRPYLGLGLGGARIKMEKADSLGGSHDKSWAFAYQALVGAEVDLSPQWQVFGQYQYVKTSGPSLASTSVIANSYIHYRLDSYPTSTTLSVGVRYSF